jgi:hypothetical protein
MPDYAEISASYSNPSQDTSNQAQRPYMIEWEIIDTFGKQWNYRETFEVGNPLFTSEIKEQQKITIPMASLSLSIPVVRELSENILFQLYDGNTPFFNTVPQLNGTYGEYYIYAVNIPPNIMVEDHEYVGLWTFSDSPLEKTPTDNPNNSTYGNVVCGSTYTDTTSGHPTNYPVRTSNVSVFTQIIHCISLWEIQRISDLRMYLDKVAKNLDLYTGYRDSDLVFHLKRGCEMLNSLGLVTNWSLQDWRTQPMLQNAMVWLLEGAKLSALRAQYLAEGDSTFDFSGQPFSLTVDRTQYLDGEISRINDGLTNIFAQAKTQLIKCNKNMGHLHLAYPSVSPYWGGMDRRNLGFPMPWPSFNG